jgi:hypothetical protein
LNGFVTRDLSNVEFQFDRYPYSHSKQFRSNIASESKFWSSVMNDCLFEGVK